MLFRHEFRVFRQFMFIKKAAHGIQIRVHSAGFADGLAWLFGRFKTADKVFGDFTHAAQRNVRRIWERFPLAPWLCTTLSTKALAAP